MATATGLLLFSSAIAGFGLGWLLRNSEGSSPLSATKVSPNRLENVTSTADTSDAIAALQTKYALLQKAPIGYLEVDDENQLLWINDLATQMLGITADANTAETARPRLLLELVRSFELDELIENTRQAQAPQQKDWTLNLVTPDPINPNEGVAYPLRGHGIVLADNHVGIFLENRLEAQTLRQQRDRWTSDVAHELKTPLTSIRLVAETLRDRVEPNSRNWVDRLLNEILRLSNLVEDLLNLSRLERSGGTGLTLKPVELPRLILAAWQSLEPLANVKQIQVAYDGPSDLIVPLDETLMYRVFINLIDNAIKYSPRESSILIRASIGESEASIGQELNTQVLCVEVIDEGTGFRDIDLPYIFNRFYRADTSRARLLEGASPGLSETETSSTGTRNSGAGLGLAIAQQIVEAHGGTILARNHPETGGGWLSITLAAKSLSLQKVGVAQNSISNQP